MSLPFDATLKDLVQAFVPDYERALGLSEFGPLTPLNVDLSTISAASDIVLGHGDPPDRAVDLNFQSGSDPRLGARGLMYNAVLHHRLGVPVHTVLVLLRPAADHASLTGRLRYQGKPRKGKMDFGYEVIRLWRQPPGRFLEGGLGTLPLATLCQLPAAVPPVDALGSVVRRIAERAGTEAEPPVRARLLAATYVLSGLRVNEAEAIQLFQGIEHMEESTTYQAILARGREKGREEGLAQGSVLALHQTLLRLGRHRFGPPSEDVTEAVQAIADQARLERMTERLLIVTSWQELLATP